MGDARFFARCSPHALAAVATAAKGTAPAIDRMFSGVAPLQSAEPDQVSFLDNRRYASALEHTSAGAVIVHPDMLPRVPSATIAIITTAAYEGWARVAELFHPTQPPCPGIHRSAIVDDDARVHPSAEIGPYVVVEAGAEIGPRCRIGTFVSIGRSVTLGADCRIGAHASLSHSLLGSRVYIYPGARIGQEGFSFAATKSGFLSIPQLGRVIIEDDVEVGANSTIDRGSTQDTVIGAGSRLDNLVQIGHNVRLGRCCVIVAQVGIAGSTVLEDFVQVGGQAAMAGHLHIGEGAQIGAQAGVINDVAAGAILLGSPAQPRTEFLRQVATLKRVARKPR
ncbi:MAG TPA: UDP-3-O-(3-hydroxymyristoyl)glucosamine N-acyltransferase [Acetobacteraceae bacterium]|jgi:UDP-3-O-[3-hydroxymyristoyl] glucosamine N-acyltransferase|nr:UDP-3-O-(3-hydroxymyristoyl)glucosamine N-acyltransferase [Acetobacteraceae bacterium]